VIRGLPVVLEHGNIVNQPLQFAEVCFEFGELYMGVWLELTKPRFSMKIGSSLRNYGSEKRLEQG